MVILSLWICLFSVTDRQAIRPELYGSHCPRDARRRWAARVPKRERLVRVPRLPIDPLCTRGLNVGGSVKTDERLNP